MPPQGYASRTFRGRALEETLVFRSKRILGTHNHWKPTLPFAGARRPPRERTYPSSSGTLPPRRALYFQRPETPLDSCTRIHVRFCFRRVLETRVLLVRPYTTLSSVNFITCRNITVLTFPNPHPFRDRLAIDISAVYAHACSSYRFITRLVLISELGSLSLSLSFNEPSFIL